MSNRNPSVGEEILVSYDGLIWHKRYFIAMWDKDSVICSISKNDIFEPNSSSNTDVYRSDIKGKTWDIWTTIGVVSRGGFLLS